MLVHPNFDQPFLLFTDASDVAIGAILLQRNKNKVNYLIAYYSKTLLRAKRIYSVTKREFLAVLLAIKHFRPFLYGTHSSIVTENSSLRWLQQMKDPDGRLARSALKLQHYGFTIVQRAGAIYQKDKGLSQLPILAYLAPEDDRVFNLIGIPDLWHLKPNPIQKQLHKTATNSQIKDGLLYKLVCSRWLPYIKASSCTETILKGHL